LIFLLQRERDQALQDSAQLHGFNANLEGYKKTVEQQLEQADEKIVEQLQTIQKLNRDKDQRDQEIFGLEEGGCTILDLVQPLRLGQHDSRSVAKRLKDVPGWLKTFWKKKSAGG